MVNSRQIQTSAARGRAIVLDGLGSADRLRLEERPFPRIHKPQEVLVRVHATSVNPIEWKMREGMGLPRFAWKAILGPHPVLGIDFSGEIVATGTASPWKEGDAVMGITGFAGAYADYLLLDESSGRCGVVAKPSAIPHEQAALVPFAGLVAYTALLKVGNLDRNRPDNRVLIAGGSGGVGHLAIQMAKRCLGVQHVTAVCSSRNEAMVRSLGADQVVCYDRVEPFGELRTIAAEQGGFHVIFDAVGDDRYWTDTVPAALRPNGCFVTAAPPRRHGRAGEEMSLSEAVRLGWRKLWPTRPRYHLVTGLITGLPTREGLPSIARWLEQGLVRPTTAATFELADMSAAHRLSETGRVAGKIAVKVA
jgi:NADPH:quinone reductase-like Zn-dependent oxidoreductase